MFKLKLKLKLKKVLENFIFPVSRTNIRFNEVNSKLQFEISYTIR